MRDLRPLIFLGLLWVAFAPAQSQAIPDSLQPARASTAMVSSGHPDASRAALRVLRQGGNAVDAAVAVGFALAVVSPDAGNLGGGGFMVVRRPDGTATTWDFREKAPLGAWREMYTDGGRSSRVGHAAAGVPGTVAGLLAAHAADGRLPLADVIAPAVALAEGQWLSGRNAILFNRYRDDFRQFGSTAQLLRPRRRRAVAERASAGSSPTLPPCSAASRTRAPTGSTGAVPPT